MKYATSVEFVIEAKDFDSAQKKRDEIYETISQKARIQHLKMVGQPREKG